MTPMPHMVQAGLILNRMSNYWEDTARPAAIGPPIGPPIGQTRMHEMLIDCLGPKIFTECRGLPSDVFGERIHVWKHWLGYEGTPGKPGKPLIDPAKATTGWWSGWKGDADRILTSTFARALQVALGYEYDENPEAISPRRWWPVDILWACGAPLFQGFVEWRTRFGTDGLGRNGHVTVILSTPGMHAGNGIPANAVSLHATPFSAAPGGSASVAAAHNDYAVEGATGFLAREQGMLIIGQPKTFNQTHANANPPAFGWDNVGTSALPGRIGPVFWTADGPIEPGGAAQSTVSVYMAEAEGGVLMGGNRP